MIRTNISLTEEQHKMITQESFSTGSSISEIIRSLIDKGLGGLKGLKGLEKLSTTPKVERLHIIKEPEELKVELKKKINLTGLCKKCGSGLKPGGDFCLGKGNHRQ